MATYAITGIPVPSGQQTPVRYEIDAWSQNKDNAIQVSLFVQALEAFQKLPVTDKLSYFQVAGIHGFPIVSWDSEPAGDYCTHGSVLFPTWHRPYLMLYEQRLYEIMLEIIERDVPQDEKDLWKLQAAQWRLPYWDWAAKRAYINDYGVPNLLTQEEVEIMLPRGTSKRMPNPLWVFRNPAGIPMGDEKMKLNAVHDSSGYPWSKCVGTSKHGIIMSEPESKWTMGVQNWQGSNSSLQNPEWYQGDPGSIAEAVYRMFTPGYFKSYETFATTSHNPAVEGSEYLSLEFIHNNIHNFTGGTNDATGVGHMMDVPVAAFDPIFWLHHCNVDRQFAMFQALYPDLWFDSPSENDPPVTTPLKPFHKDGKGTTWVPDDVRHTDKLGYVYDSLVAPPPTRHRDGRVDHGKYVKHIVKKINTHYGKLRHDFRNIPSDLKGVSNDYIINIVYDRYALNGRPYTIHFFLGSADRDEVTVLNKHPNHVGSVYTFSMDLEARRSYDNSGCGNCEEQKKAGTLAQAQIHLTSVLLRHVMDENRPLESLVEEEVERYLVEKLEWKAEAAPGVPIRMDQLPKTKIFVMRGRSEHPSNDEELSRYHGYEHMWSPCVGKPGGADPSDNLTRVSMST